MAQLTSTATRPCVSAVQIQDIRTPLLRVASGRYPDLPATDSYSDLQAGDPDPATRRFRQDLPPAKAGAGPVSSIRAWSAGGPVSINHQAARGHHDRLQPRPGLPGEPSRSSRASGARPTCRLGHRAGRRRAAPARQASRCAIDGAAVIYVLLACSTRATIHPITILAGSVGAWRARHAVGLRHDLSIIAMIGVLMLIDREEERDMMIDFALDRREAGAGTAQAIREACVLRFRPIMMTTSRHSWGASHRHGPRRRGGAAPALASRCGGLRSRRR